MRLQSWRVVVGLARHDEGVDVGAGGKYLQVALEVQLPLVAGGLPALHIVVPGRDDLSVFKGQDGVAVGVGVPVREGSDRDSQRRPG